MGAVATLGVALWVTAALAAQSGNPDAAKLQNPTPATAESVAAGQKIYQRHCRVCHGAEGKGGRKLEEGAAASNFTDATWDHGSTDGEIFWVIKNGVPPEMTMAAYEEQLGDADIWHLVNYIRTLAK